MIPEDRTMFDHVRDTLRRASQVVEAPRRRTEEAVRKLAENPNFDVMDAPQLASDMLRRGKEQADKARSMIDDTVRRRLNTLGLATREDVEVLRRRIAELEAAAASAVPPAPPAAPEPPAATKAGAARPATRGRARATATGPTPGSTNGTKASG
jgi:polyhydroxyalkanoate synthesis regulator phasin